MFYKNNYLSTTTVSLLTDSPEFIYELYEKMSVFPRYSLGILQGKNKEGQELCSTPVVCDNESLKTYTTIKGERLLNNFTYKLYLEKYPDLSTLDLVPLTKQQYLVNFPNLNMEKLNISSDIVKDFYNLEVEKIVNDKFGEEYKMTIISNADTTIGDTVIIDRLYLEIQGRFIGSLKVKYTTEAIQKLLNHNKNNNDLFMNCATIDYSDLDEDYRNKGLGYVMYFHMSQYLTQKNIDFRQSTMQSPYAKRLWNGIKNKMSSCITFKTINGQDNTAFLKISQDYILNFMNQDIQIETNTKNNKIKI